MKMVSVIGSIMMTMVTLIDIFIFWIRIRMIQQMIRPTSRMMIFVRFAGVALAAVLIHVPYVVATRVLVLKMIQVSTKQIITAHNVEIIHVLAIKILIKQQRGSLLRQPKKELKLLPLNMARLKHIAIKG